jgi:type IV pilus assembly protein PilC
MLISYRALKGNKIIKGKLDAQNEKAVLIYLRNQGYFPIEIKPVNRESNFILGSFFNRVTFTDIVDFTRQVAIMLNAGLTLIDCFEILKKQTNKASLLDLVEDLEKDVKGGSPFSAALKKYPQHFSNLYISLVKSGEASGKLSDILLKLAENLEKQREFQGKIRGAMIYPAILVVGMIAVIFIVVTFVIPKLLDLYKDFNIQLPLTTQILMLISSFSAKFWPIILLSIFGTVTLVNRFLKTKQGKYLFDSNLLKVPLVKNVVKISALVDSTRTLSILIGSGVSIMEALSIIIETTDNVIFQKAFENIHKKVEKGMSLGTAMQQEEVFPPILIQMTLVGEQTGKLDETLGRISHYFEMESEIAVKTLTTLIEPSILIFLGLGVGLLVTSVITPIYQLTSSFK